MPTHRGLFSEVPDTVLYALQQGEIDVWALAVWVALWTWVPYKSVGANKPLRVWPSIRSISERAGVSERIVCDKIRMMERAGLLKVDRNRGNRRSSTYTLLRN